MALARVVSSTLHGIESLPVEVEVQIRGGPFSFSIIGLADNAVRESRDRVAAAIRHSGFEFRGKVLVNLAPAEIKKEGAALDLAIAVGYLAASHVVPFQNLNRYSFHGELSLTGELKPVRGVIARGVGCIKSEKGSLVVPSGNVR